jgi:SAM-dependent methyltransferase
MKHMTTSRTMKPGGHVEPPSPSSRDFDLERSLAALKGQAGLIPESLRAWWLTYLKEHRAHFANVLEFLPRNRNTRLLEIGAVPGQLTLLLREAGFQLSTVDLAPQRLQRFWEQNGISVHPVDVETEALPFPAESFDFVLFTEILEHLRINPLFALKEVHRVLSPGGRILLSTPNITPVDRLQFLLGQDYQGDPVAEFERLASIGHMGHIRLYSLSDVHRFIEHTGFCAERFERRGHRRYAGKKGLLARLYPAKSHLRSHLYMLAGKEATVDAMTNEMRKNP